MREARILLPGTDEPMAGTVEGGAAPSVRIGARTLSAAQFSWAPPASGLVYGVVLNDRRSLERLGSALSEPPYQASPQAPILYVKPYNTHTGHRSRVHLPAGAEEVEIGATLGIVIGADTARVPAQHALEHVRGYTVVADLSLPHASYFRPAIREKCFDGACPMGPWLLARDALPDPHSAAVRTYADGNLLDEHNLEDALRPIPQLIADVSEFMTLKAGDVLLCGVRYGAPRVAAGAQVEVAIEGVGRLAFAVERAEQQEITA